MAVRSRNNHPRVSFTFSLKQKRVDILFSAQETVVMPVLRCLPNITSYICGFDQAVHLSSSHTDHFLIKHLALHYSEPESDCYVTAKEMGGMKKSDKNKTKPQEAAKVY